MYDKIFRGIVIFFLLIVTSMSFHFATMRTAEGVKPRESSGFS